MPIHLAQPDHYTSCRISPKFDPAEACQKTPLQDWGRKAGKAGKTSAKLITANTAKDLNDLSHQVIGIAIDIHKKLGPGFQERIYEQALLKEFENAGIGFEQQKVVRVDYDGQSLGNQRIDLLVSGEIILEINPSTPRSEARGTPFDKLKALSPAEGLRVDTERRL